jgi:hypothetical protein
VTVAAVMLVLLKLLNLVPLAIEGMPAVCVYGALALGAAGLVGAAGLWMLRKWGIRLSIVVCALNLVSAAPGIPFAPDAALRVAALVTVLFSALIIVLVVLPARGELSRFPEFLGRSAPGCSVIGGTKTGPLLRPRPLTALGGGVNSRSVVGRDNRPDRIGTFCPFTERSPPDKVAARTSTVNQRTRGAMGT